MWYNSMKQYDNYIPNNVQPTQISTLLISMNKRKGDSCLHLISLHTLISSSISFVVNVRISSFSWLSNIPSHIHSTFSLSRNQLIDI